MTTSILKCYSSKDVLEKLQQEFDRVSDKLPSNLNASIVIKPNLNSNLDALTGNTTDLRVLSAMLRILTNRGYKNILILEGPNGGYHREGIDVFLRNRIDALAIKYGCKFRDVNYEKDTLTVELSNSEKIQIPKAFIECDLFINVPKLKTHYETLISVALKSLVGIAVGQPNKAKMHLDLYENILRLNDIAKAHIYVVDGLIAMEGNGPSAGDPVLFNTILTGDNPYEIDIAACFLMGFDPNESPLIQTAIKSGRIKSSLIDKNKPGQKYLVSKSFVRPNLPPLAKFLALPHIKGIVRVVRNNPPVSLLLKNTYARRMLFKLGLTQEVLLNEEKDVRLEWDANKCDSCGKCLQYCPDMLELPKAFNTKIFQCLNCLYCYSVCPNEAIKISGKLGYYKEQIKRYGDIIKRIA